MRRSILFVILILFSILFSLSACGPKVPLGFQPQIVTTQGRYVHRGSGIFFPKTIGLYPRGQITTYDAGGSDISVGYNLIDKRNPVAMTVYVYPGPRIRRPGPSGDPHRARRLALAGHFEEVKRFILNAHPEAVEYFDDVEYLVVRSNKFPGRVAKYEYDGVFAGKQQRLISYAYLFAYGDWFVKYRATYPKRIGKRGEFALKNFRDNFEGVRPKHPQAEAYR